MNNRYANYYYNFLIGEYHSDEDYRTTSLTFDYIKEAAGLNDTNMFSLINKFPVKDAITFEDIPGELWNKSLLEKDKFYYHKELQVLSPPPSWTEDKPFFREIRISYTLDNVLDYFIKRSGVREEWVNRDKELGSIKYLFKDYKKFDFIEPVDFLLHLIDYCVSSGIELNSIYDLRDKEIELANYLEIDTANAIAKGKNKVIWRS